jgi:hypothetical protein
MGLVLGMLLVAGYMCPPLGLLILLILSLEFPHFGKLVLIAVLVAAGVDTHIRSKTKNITECNCGNRD